MPKARAQSKAAPAPEVPEGQTLYSSFTDAQTGCPVTVRTDSVGAVGQHADGSAYIYTSGQRILLAETAAEAREVLGWPALEGAGE